MKTKIRSAIKTIDMLYGPPMDVMSDCLRGFIKAPTGRLLCGGDYSQIEARKVPWLAGHDDDLHVFASGRDIYLKAAADVFKREFTKDDPERQIGKVSTLGLGFGGGVGAFQSMARLYNVKVSDERAEEIKVAWREAHQEVVNYWYGLERAAVNAIKNPNTRYRVGSKYAPHYFIKRGSFLICVLPSGRPIFWAYPHLKKKMMPWGKEKDVIHFWGVDTWTKQWSVQTTYGGKLCENITQASARDVLRDALIRLDDLDWAVFMHVHDEALAEIDDDGADYREDLEKIMCNIKPWCRDLPIAAEAWQGKRYRK